MDKKFLPERLKQLLVEKRKPDGDRYSYREVAEFTSLTPSYISHLVTGKRTNPSLDTLTALAKFFQVNVNYFYGEDSEEPEAFLEIVAMRSSGLNKEEKDLILKMMEVMAKDDD